MTLDKSETRNVLLRITWIGRATTYPRTLPTKRNYPELRVAESHGRRVVVSQVASSVNHRRGRSLPDGNYRTMVSVIRVTIPRRIRMKSNTSQDPLRLPLLQDEAGKRRDCTVANRHSRSRVFVRIRVCARVYMYVCMCVSIYCIRMHTRTRAC